MNEDLVDRMTPEDLVDRMSPGNGKDDTALIREGRAREKPRSPTTPHLPGRCPP